MADNILCDSMCDALKALVSAAITAMAPQPDPVPEVVTAKESGDKELPIIICEADGEGEDEPLGTGNFWVTAGITLKHSSVEDAGATSGAAKSNEQAIFTAICNAIQTDTIESDLTTAARTAGHNFTVFPGSLNLQAPHRDQDEAGVWEDTIQFKASCCASNL